MKKITSIFIILLSISVLSINSLAHQGRLDSQNGHNKTSDGTYHYHDGEDRTIEYSSKDEINNPTVEKPVDKPVDNKEEVIKVYIDGDLIIFDQEPIIIPETNRTVVPIRAIAEKLGYNVDWEGLTKSVFINSVDVPREGNGELTNEINVYLDNVKFNFLDQKPIIKNSRTLLPIRAILEEIGCSVNWIGETRSIVIESPK